MKLVVEQLAVERGERVIFEDVSFGVDAGRALLVTGANGSGKSTLLKAIAGFLRPSAGTIALEGRDPEKSLAEHCHYLAHANALKLQSSVHENLQFWQAYLGPGQSVAASLEAVGLGGIGSMPAGFLSAGQKRRAAIARLLVSYRPVWLVDEPTAALDAASGAQFEAIVATYLGGGGIVLAATHQPLAIARAGSLEMRGFGGGLAA